jgi:hypothetical protein
MFWEAGRRVDCSADSWEFLVRPASPHAVSLTAVASWATIRRPLWALLTLCLVACGGGDEASQAQALAQEDRARALAASIAPLVTALVWVGAANGAPIGAKVYSNLQAVPWGSLAAGTLVKVAPGTYPGTVTIISVARPQRPPVFRPPTPAYRRW